jgi:hypothetical protein
LPELAWVGWVLAIAITVLQLIFNKGVYSNPTLFAAGILAYVYGVITNIIGIMRAQQILDSLISEFTTDMGHYVPRAILAIVLALVIEIVPEALLLWAIFTDKIDFGDFLTSIYGGTNLSRNKNKNVRRNVQKHVHNRPQDRDGTRPGHGTGQDGTKKGQDTERTVVKACGEYVRDEKEIPSVRYIAKKTGISKTVVGNIMKQYRNQWQASLKHHNSGSGF